MTSAKLWVFISVAPGFLVGVLVESARGWETYGGNAAHDGYVSTSLDPRGFRAVWNRELPMDDFFAPGSLAVAADGAVYVSTTANPAISKTYSVYALNLSDGQTRWQTDFDSRYRWIGDPTIVDSTVYVHLYGHSFTTGDTPNPALYALDSQTGGVLFATDHEGQSRSGGQPVVAVGRVFAPGGAYGGLDAYDALSGERLWFRLVEQDDNWVPAADEDHVYVYDDRSSTSGGRLVVFDATTGVQAFAISDPNSPLANQLARTPVLDGQGRAFVSVPDRPSFTSRLIAFNLDAQEIDWEFTLQESVIFTGEIATDGESVFASAGNELYEVNVTDGQLLNSWVFPSSLTDSLLLTDSHAMVSTSLETLAINRATGRVEWTLPESGRLSYADGRLLIANRMGVTAFVAVPEPATIASLGFAFAGLMGSVGGRFFRGRRLSLPALAKRSPSP